MTIYIKGRFGYWIGVKCASVMVNQLTIYFFIVRLLWICGLWFWVFWSKLVYATVCYGPLACWQSRLGCHRNGHIWLIVPHCLMWCLWRERNSRYFEDNELSIPDLKLFFFKTLLDWLATLRNQSFSSFLDFLDSCDFCS